MSPWTATLLAVIALLWTLGPVVGPHLFAGPPEPRRTASFSPDDEEMSLIPAGEFLMGSAEREAERPVHKVHVDAFYMDTHLVTNRRYKRFLEATGYKPPPGWPDRLVNDPDHPLMGGTWDDAMAFCKWAEKRLPTEAEWEKAARGGLEGKRYPWGDDDPQGRACFGLSSIDGRPAVVGSFEPNGYGLFDMAGLMQQWCSDWYSADFYKESPSRNPRGPESGEFRAVRGGFAWTPDGKDIRCAYRYYAVPRFRGFGFRCARDVGK